jgi:hypothetical protein
MNNWIGLTLILKEPFIMEKTPNKMIDGFTFHMELYKTLRGHVLNYEDAGYEKPLSCSALGIYTGLMSVVQPSGLLPADFRLGTLAASMNIPRQTAYDGFQMLLDRGLVFVRELKDDSSQFEIAYYEQYNRPYNESLGTHSSVNYFLVPYEALKSNVIAKLVSSAKPHSLLLLLDLSNRLTRTVNEEKQSRVYKMTTLKDKLKLSSGTRVRKVLDILSPLFTIKPINAHERNPRLDVANRVREAVTQFWVKDFDISVSSTCLKDRIEVDTDVVYYLKSAAMHIKSLELPLPEVDRRGIEKSYRATVRAVAQLLPDLTTKRDLLKNAMMFALERLELSAKTETIKSIGAFMNKMFQIHVLDFLQTSEFRSNVLLGFSMNDAQPHIIKKHRELVQAQLAK